MLGTANQTLPAVVVLISTADSVDSSTFESDAVFSSSEQSTTGLITDRLARYFNEGGSPGAVLTVCSQFDQQSTQSLATALCHTLERYSNAQIILDLSKAGEQLDSVQTMIDQLLPIASLVIIQLSQGLQLLGKHPDAMQPINRRYLMTVMNQLASIGCGATLLKAEQAVGGQHIDHLVDEYGVQSFVTVADDQTSATAKPLAIAECLARGLSIRDAIAAANEQAGDGVTI